MQIDDKMQEELEKQIDEEQDTLKKLKKIAKINVKINDKFKKKCPKWKDYLDLYNECIKSFNKRINNYEKALIEFNNHFENIDKNQDKLKPYCDELTKACDDTGRIINSAEDLNDKIYSALDNIVEKIKQTFIDANPKKKAKYKALFDIKDEKELTAENLMGKYNNNFAQKAGDFLGFKQGKSIFLGAYNDQRKQFSDALKKIREDFAKTKTEISKVVGILSNRSIKRNIKLETENAPLKILVRFYEALKSNGTTTDLKKLKYKNKDLLDPKIQKNLKEKVKNSMQKVINCKWDEYENRVKELGAEDLQDIIDEIKDDVQDSDKIINQNINMLQKNSAAEPAHVIKNLEKVCENTREIPKEYGKKSKLASFLANVLSYKLGSLIIFSSLTPLLNALKEESGKTGTELIGDTMVDQNTIMNKLLVALKWIGTLLSFIPTIGGFFAELGDLAEGIIELVDVSMGLTEDQLSKYMESKELKI